MGFSAHLDKRLEVRPHNEQYIQVMMIHMGVNTKQLLKYIRYCRDKVFRKNTILAFIVGRTLEEIGNVLEEGIDILVCTHLPLKPHAMPTLTGLLPWESVHKYV